MDHEQDPANAKSGSASKWALKLYVAGMLADSQASIASIQKICDEHLAGRYALEIIDLLAEPTRARADQILVVPTLVRCAPPPQCRLVGDLTCSEKVLMGLKLLST